MSMFWAVLLGASLISISEALLDNNYCSVTECEKNSRLKCEAEKSIFVQRGGFCYCCHVTPPEGEKGTCDKKYCEITKMPVATKADCDARYEVFKRKNVAKCICQDKCEPIWVKTPNGEECGKALCAFNKVCPEILCGIDHDYFNPDACHCCRYCKPKKT